ncbi:hypothetical protein ILFOPFJJ_04993 [Ensifer psoraleae]|uniref:hypothetical protein n=1 Tax=Sinorhizobium psoraleae TaxID=520838 RepID=UPI0015695EDE|nr:hypothetical protein [Sinorhizobium psoraleae]NRP74072.1 hypothetical protein [Sinorhizobium psoraleae]
MPLYMGQFAGNCSPCRAKFPATHRKPIAFAAIIAGAGGTFDKAVSEPLRRLAAQRARQFGAIRAQVIPIHEYRGERSPASAPPRKGRSAAACKRIPMVSS